MYFNQNLKLVEYGINRAKYHGGDLVGVSIQWVLQNASSIIKESAVIVIKKYIISAETA